MKKIILTDRKLDEKLFENDVDIICTKNLKNYNHNENVVAIVGSRAMAKQCDELNFPGLKLYQLTSAGFDGVPCESFAKKGIAIANAGSVYSMPIAETVVFGMLLMAKKLHANPNNRHIKIQRRYNTITELGSKKVLIMSVGNIGTAIANRLQGFGVEIDGYDPFCPEKEQVSRIWRNRDELLKEIGQYDYIISTMPDNEHTKGFINAELFERMKNTAVVVNVGRKAVFHETDFYNALKKKTIGGAVLDMFEKIPNPLTNRFRRLRNVIVLPGVSAISQEVNGRLKEHITKNLLAVINGNKIENVINGVK